jgi:hypothetical protein
LLFYCQEVHSNDDGTFDSYVATTQKEKPILNLDLYDNVLGSNAGLNLTAVYTDFFTLSFLGNYQ